MAGLIGLLGLAGAAAVRAGPAVDALDAEVNYQKQLAACEAGAPGQDKAACLREARAARAASKDGELADGDASYRQNALQRCRALPDADRKDCEARINGQGSTSGSVQGGGVLRELRTKEIASAPR